MKVISLFVFICLFLIPWSHAQEFHGEIVDQKNSPVAYASVRWADTNIVTLSDSTGHFILVKPESVKPVVIVKYAGYEADTFTISPSGHSKLVLSKSIVLEGVVIEQDLATSFHSSRTVHGMEVLREGELQKAACCNLSESFETNATIDVSFADAITGAKTIQMLGLDGKYVQMTTELVPILRGLATPYGLTYYAGTWLESIQIGKGVGSVVNGYEGMTGQINLELKKPENSERILFNFYGNHMGRLEANLNFSQKVGEKWATATLLHGDYFNTTSDHNKDGFTDLPLLKQGGGIHRWSYFSKNFETQFGIRGLYENRSGGNMAFFGKDSTTVPYGVNLATYRGEAFAKFGILFPGMPWKSIGIITNGVFHRQEGFYGARQYIGEQKSGYINAIYASILSNTMHKFKTGASFMVDDISETFADTTLQRLELVPGGFFEYTYHNLKNFTLQAGFRMDYHNLFGLFPLPRLHIKYEPVEGLHLRLAGGRGFRIPVIFAENTSTLMTGRQVVIEDGLFPEVSWNYGISANYTFQLWKRDASVSADFFRTDFTDQLMVDREAQDKLRFYQLEGASFSNVFQLNFDFNPLKWWNIRIGYKYQDVRASYDGIVKRVPLVPEHKGLVNTSFTFKKIGLLLDFTVNVSGPSRYPDVVDPISGETRPGQTPWFALMNAQVTKKFKRVDIYIGGENLGGYHQVDPIINPQDPFSDTFDASLVYAPLFRQMFYAGVRIKLDYYDPVFMKKKKP